VERRPSSYRERMSQETPTSTGRPWLVYSGLRLLVFIGTAGFFAIFGLNGFALLVVAVLVSGIVSLLVLRAQREAVASAQLARRERRAAERDAMRARLDDA
jgi:4-amino-4-deoxy-L-arabinose transferase-like glycosyltransferase